MATGVAPRLQSECGARERPGWVRFPHVPATLPRAAAIFLLAASLASLAPAGGAAAQVPADTAMGEEGPSQEEPPAVRDTVPPISPVGALARSLVLPGWGQLEVGRPVRGGIYFAAEALSLVMVFKTQAKLRAARRAEPVNEALVESRVGQRENWIVLAGFWAFLSGLDAWVSTHFWDFEPEVRPPEDGSAGLELRWSVPVGGL